MIMRGMMDDVVPRLRPGAVVIARTVRVEGTGEGVIAEPLEALAKAHPGALARQLSVLRPARATAPTWWCAAATRARWTATVDELIAALAADIATIIPDPVEAPR